MAETILIADDDPDIVFMRLSLNIEGFDVPEAHNGARVAADFDAGIRGLHDREDVL